MKNDDATARESTTFLERLAAAQMVMGSKRRAIECDILLTTVLLLLRGKELSTTALLAKCQETWPGARVQLAQLETALLAGASAGYLVRAGEVQEEWSLTGVAQLEAGTSETRAGEMLDRTRSDLVRRARESLREPTSDEASMWMDIVVRSLFEGIRTAHSPFTGEVEKVTDTLLPKRYNVEGMVSSVRKRCGEPELGDFLAGVVLEAVDPSVPFGTELVNGIAISYTLLAFLGRRDYLQARGIVGSLSGCAVVLDTPVLVPLLGVGRRTDAVLRAIDYSIRAGMRVVVTRHTIKELQALTRRVRREFGEILTGKTEHNELVEMIRRLSDEPLLDLWAEAQQAGRYNTWSDVEREAEGLAIRLESLGVQVEDHANRWREDKVAVFRDSLKEVLAKDGVDRGPKQVESDADTMAFAARTRRLRRSPSGFWPSMWVVTTDRRMNRAYSGVNPDDSFPLTLTPSHWVGMLGTCAEPASLADLASDAVTFLAHETVIAIASEYTAEVAVDIARVLHEGGGMPAVDLRLAGISSPEMLLHEQPDLFGDERENVGAQYAAVIVAMRNARLSQAQGVAMRRMQREREDADARTAALEARLQKVTERESTHTNDADDRIGQVESEIADLTDRLEDEQLLSPRRQARAAIASALGCAAAFLLFYGFGGAALVFAVSTFCFLGAAEKWVSNPRIKWHRVLVSAIPGVVGVAIAVFKN